jgi:cytochrome c5
MKANIRHLLARSVCMAVLAGAVATSTGCIGEIGGDDPEAAPAPALTSGSSWSLERDRREAEIAAYLTANNADFKSFKNAAVGNSGIPMIMLRVFPEIFPEIWGKPSDFFAPVGLAQDTLEPGRVLPLGLGFLPSQPAIQTAVGPVNVNVVQLTCMGCHSGRVIDATGKVKHIIGGPNTTFNQFRVAVSRTVNSPKYTADAFRAAIAAKPLGFIYGDPALAQQEALERAIFLAPGSAEVFLDKLKTGSNAFAARFGATLGAFTYAVPNAPNPSASKPGFLDAIGAGIAIIVDPTKFTPDQLRAILPPAPAEIDIMSTWRQLDRPLAQWDGSIGSILHRNIAAEFGVVGNPAAVNMDNGIRSTRFTNNLPPTPYPFDVDTAAAARGKDLFVAYCVGCHAAGSRASFAPETVGTDANRAILWSPFTVGGLIQVLRLSCSDPVACSGPDGQPLSDAQIVSPTFGYMALPLAGIWARAPYLHNGSVPSLAALLTGNRPSTFFRGNLTYDQKTVGFTWDRAVTPGATSFDTGLSGAANTGHLGPQFNGPINWANDPKRLADLLEYMKTL